MSDSAVGPISGFFYQFEKALLLLSQLVHANDFISVENVDDIAAHDGQLPYKILFAYHAKHSLSMTGTTFEDTSKALWRTLELWVQKCDEGVFDGETQFVCSTNKSIPADALIRKIISGPFKETEKLILDLQKKMKEDLAQKLSDGKSAPHISYILKILKYLLGKKQILEKISSRIKIEDGEDVKPRFLEAVRLSLPTIRTARQDDVYHSFYGWLVDTCQANWRNGKTATISKQQFDAKWTIVNSNPQIINAIFRKKTELGSLTPERQAEVKDELFVKQLNDISRGPGAKYVLEQAMLDYIHHEIEIAFVIYKGDFTSTDFEVFRRNCLEAWQRHFYSMVLKDEYSEEESNAIAISLFDTIMKENSLQFNEGFQFTPSNIYIKNGSFLKLSNIPQIGWRPDWQVKYGKP